MKGPSRSPIDIHSLVLRNIEGLLVLQQLFLLYVPPMLHTGPPQGMHRYIEGGGKQFYIHWCLEERHELQTLLACLAVRSPVREDACT